MESDQPHGLDGLEDLARARDLHSLLAGPIAETRASLRDIASLSPQTSVGLTLELATSAIESTAFAFGLAIIKSRPSAVPRRANILAGAFASAEQQSPASCFASEQYDVCNGRIAPIPSPAPGSRAAAEVEQLRRAGAKLEAEIAARNANPLPLPDLAALLRDAE